MLQERYLSREAITALEALPFDIGLCLVTDDVAPDYLLERGHLDQVLRRTIELGMHPMRALRAVTFNPARRMRLWDRGLIAPGRAADIVLVDDLANFQARTVLVDGKVVAQDGRSSLVSPGRRRHARPHRHSALAATGARRLYRSWADRRRPRRDPSDRLCPWADAGAQDHGHSRSD